MARHRCAEETLVPTPSALVRRRCDALEAGTGLSAPPWLTVFFMEFDAAAGSRTSIGVDDPFPPAIMGPPSNTDQHRLCGDKARFERLMADSYGGRRQADRHELDETKVASRRTAVASPPHRSCR